LTRPVRQEMKTEGGSPSPQIDAGDRNESPDNRVGPRSVTSVACATLIHPLTSVLEPLDPARLFPRPQPLEVELGSGDGSFAVQYAQRQPDCNFLAVERLLGRLRKIDRKGRRAG